MSKLNQKAITVIEELIETYKQLERIANTYANKATYGSATQISINTRDNSFSFRMLPSTSGIGSTVTLPLSLLDATTEELDDYITKDIQRVEKERLAFMSRNTCQRCGHFRNNESTW